MTDGGADGAPMGGRIRPLPRALLRGRPVSVLAWLLVGALVVALFGQAHLTGVADSVRERWLPVEP